MGSFGDGPGPFIGATRKQNGLARDSRHLTPSLPARMAPKSRALPNEMEAHKEGPVEAQHGSNPGRLGLREQKHSQLARRDIRQAAIPLALNAPSQ